MRMSSISIDIFGFSTNEIRLLCVHAITCSSSFSVIHMSVNIKNNIGKDLTLLLFFFSLKVQAAM